MKNAVTHSVRMDISSVWLPWKILKITTHISLSPYCTVSVVVSDVTMNGYTSPPWPLSIRIRLNCSRAYAN